MENEIAKNLKIIKWNIYNVKVPFTTNFCKNKTRSVVVIIKVGGDVIILPISSQINKKSKHDIIIKLNKPSLIKVANIQSINQKDIISPYYSIKMKKILKVDNKLKILIERKLIELLINKK